MNVSDAKSMNYTIDQFNAADEQQTLASLYEIAFNDKNFWSSNTSPEQRQRIIMYIDDANIDINQKEQINQIFNAHFEDICHEFDSVMNFFSGSTKNVELISLSNLLKCLLDIKQNNEKTSTKYGERTLMQLLKNREISEQTILCKVELLFENIEITKEALPQLIQISHYFNQLTGKADYFHKYNRLLEHRGIGLFYKYPCKNDILKFESTPDGLKISLKEIFEVENLNSYALTEFLKSMPEVKISLEFGNRHAYGYFVKELGRNIYQLSFKSVGIEYLDLAKLEDYLKHMVSIELNLYDCPGIVELLTDKPFLKKIHSLKVHQCQNLEIIDLPNVKSINAVGCPKLHSINAQNAVDVCAPNNHVLNFLIAPKALKISCANSSCTKLIATAATKIDCSFCPKLTDVESDHIKEVNWVGTHPMAKEKFKPNLYKTVIENHISKNLYDFIKPDKDLNLHSTLFLGQWFVDLYEAEPPFAFDSSEEKQKFDITMENHFQKLKEQLKPIFGDVNLDWLDYAVNNMTRLHLKRELLIQIHRMIVSLSFMDTKALSDSRTTSMLKVIFSHPNKHVQRAAIDYLLHSYKNGNQDKLLSGIDSKFKEWQYLPYLFFVAANLDSNTRNSLMTSIGKTYYKPHNIINPILEMLAAFYSHPVTLKTYRDLLCLTLKEIPQMDRERKPAFLERLKESRNNQEKAIRLIKEFLFTNIDLQEVKNCEDLFKLEIKICQELFGVDEAMALKISNAFMSERYPRGLFTYASQLHFLDVASRKAMLASFHSFIKSVLDGKYPESRYDLAENSHLRMVFENRPELLEKWKTPYSSSVDTIKNDGAEPASKVICEVVKDSDEWEDILLMGTEVHHSCQHIKDDIENNKSLLGAIRDGKIKIMVVKDEQNRIIARSVLRILLDKVTNEPVLFLEQLYTRHDHPQLSNLILHGAIEKAKSMQLPLLTYGGFKENAEKYPHVIECREVFGDYEYLDSAGGIKKMGASYSIQSGSIMYTP